MRNLRIYNMLTENDICVDDIVLQVPVDYDCVMLFDMIMDKTGIDVRSYSYEEVE